MTSQPGLQTGAIDILQKSHKVTASRQWNLEKIFFSKNYAKNDAGRLVPDLSLFF